MESIVEICKEVLERLTTIGYEKESLVSSGQLIFPTKRGGKRISEQELRQLFIEEFKVKHKKLYFSIETPTVHSYSFTNVLKQIKIGDEANNGQSALIDLCILEKKSETSNYTRLLNIEFKYKNATEANISKDILKLMHEEENGAFVLLLKNTNSGTLNSLADKRDGVIDKLIASIKYHHNEKNVWNGAEKKSIELIILSLEEKEDKTELPFIMHRTIIKSEIETLVNRQDNWKREYLKDGLFQVRVL